MDILVYTLDILMTNIEYKLHLNRKTYRHSYLKWHGLLLHPYASSCCSFPQRSSSLTHLSRSSGKMFNQLQRSWWSHYMAVFLLRPRLQLMNSCPESLLPARKGDFYKDEVYMDTVALVSGLATITIPVPITSRWVDRYNEWSSALRTLWTP